MTATIWITIAALLFSASSAAEFVPAKQVSEAKMSYPKASLVRWQEGWGQAAMMIDASGTPYDFVVIESSGHTAFESALRKTALAGRYSPATLNGTPVEDTKRFVGTYIMSRNTAGSRQFVRRQKKLNAAIEREDRKNADRFLKLLESSTLSVYETAFLNVSRYHYYGVWGTPHKQLKAISAASFWDKSERFLPENSLTTALLRRMALELELGYVGKASRTASWLERLNLDDAKAARLAELEAKETERLDNDPVIARVAHVGDNGQYAEPLVRRRFSIESVSGTITNVRVQCQRGLQRFEPVASTIQEVPQALDSCLLAVDAEPGTTFELRTYAQEDHE